MVVREGDLNTAGLGGKLAPLISTHFATDDGYVDFNQNG
jgi:hypothetical protein